MNVSTDRYVTSEAMVQHALNLLREPLRRFVADTMARVHGEQWYDYARGRLHSRGLSYVTRRDFEGDLGVLLNTVLHCWHPEFRGCRGRFDRAYFEEARAFRNAVHHGKRFTRAGAFRAIDTVQQLLQLMSAEPSGTLAHWWRKLARDLERECPGQPPVIEDAAA